MISDPNKPNEVNVQIDGQWHRFPVGTRLIEACAQVGQEVPHYCYHPKLTSPGNCRMCLIEMGMPKRDAQRQVVLGEDGMPEIAWMPKPQISCASTVSEGMGVRTGSPLVKECRESVMEFLLINHPLDCPICDQAGECELQEYSVEHGKGSSRFLERKVKKPKNVTLGPRVTLDDERCILCSRCVRFCQEIVEDDVLGFVDRGSYNTLTTHPDKQLENNYSLNTVDLCPVGALTSSDFRFQMRVWFLKETNSFCTSCARGCNTVIGSREDRVKRQTPRENNAVNSTWMCDHGRLNFHYLESDARLTSPLLREAESHRPVAWEEAISYAVTQLQKYEPQEIAIVASARMTNEELFAVERLRQTLGTSWIDVIPRTGEADEFLVAADRNPNTLGAKTIFGIEPGSHLTEIRAQIATGHVKALLCFGENLYRADFNDEMLDELEFFLCSHILANPVAQKAHVVLPGAGFAEKKGTMINATGRLQRLGVAVEPPGEARSDWEFLQELAAVFSEGERIFHYEEWYAQMAAAVELLAGTSWSKVGDEGIALLETGEKVPLLERERERLEAGLIVG